MGIHYAKNVKIVNATKKMGKDGKLYGSFQTVPSDGSGSIFDNSTMLYRFSEPHFINQVDSLANKKVDLEVDIEYNFDWKKYDVKLISIKESSIK